MRRSNLLVLLGIAFFLVGGVIVLLITNDDGDGGGGAGDAKAVVVVGTEDIKAGDLANDLIKAKRLKEVEVPVSEVLPGAVQSVSQLTGATFTQGFGEDQQIVQAGLLLQNRTFDVPKGFEAVVVQLDFVGGGAGYVYPGDKINVYGTLQTGEAKLLLTNVEVLDVNLTIPPRRGTTPTDATTNGVRATGDVITYLLAVKTNDAEKLIFLTEFGAGGDGLYATLPAEDSPPAGPTGGRQADNIFSEEANVAANK